MHINGGKHGDSQFISVDNLQQMHQPQVTVPPQPPFDFPEIQHTSYGLGWMQHVYRGYSCIRHTGEIDGFISDVSFMPQPDIGVIVFNNSEDALSNSVAMYIYDCLLGLEPIDWRERLEAAKDKIKASVKEGVEAFAAKRQPNTQPSHPLTAYVGSYEHPGYGLLRIEQVNDKLHVKYNTRQFTLKHFHYNVFYAEHTLGDDVPPFPATFQLRLDGQIGSFNIQLEDGVDAIVFARKQSEEI
jgi:hypothetical protein